MRKGLASTLVFTLAITSIAPVGVGQAASEVENFMEESIEAEVVEPAKGETIELEVDAQENGDTANPDDIPANEEDNTTEIEQPIVLKEMTLTVDKNIAIIGGEQFVLDVAPGVRNGTTYVELRFVVEQLLNGEAKWDETTGETIITKGGKNLKVKPDSTVAIVDGIKLDLPGAVLVENSRTLVPLRFLAEQFGIKVEFIQQNNTIKLTDTGVIPPAIIVPVAQFEFVQQSYIQGQKIEAKENSYSEDNSPIVQTMWRVDGDPAKVGKTLDSVFRKPTAGIHTIELRVKNKKGIWSEWVSQTIEILPNEKPVITELSLGKSSYAQGEELKLGYNYTNEDWEGIKEVRWDYRAVNDPEHKKIQLKPKALFTPGQYVVRLQLVDDYGNHSEFKEEVITITKDKVMSEFEYKFTRGEHGEIIDNFGKVNYRSYIAEDDIVVIDNQETLIMSDSPERVVSNGILYQDLISGKGRLMIHHVNGFTEEENKQTKKRIAITVGNGSNQPVNLTIKNKVVKGPNSVQLYLGQQLLVDYLKGAPAEQYVVPPGGTVVIYDSAGTRWNKEDGLSGLMDFETDGPLMVRVAAVDEKTPVSAIATMPKPARDAHPRGTFPLTEKHYQINLDSKYPTSLLLCEDNTDWVTGHDAITGQLVENKGNYGVTCKFTITAKEDTGIILNERGGFFCGAIKWDDGKVYKVPNVGFLPEYERAAFIGLVKAGETVTFEYMMPNGSAAPVLLGFIPRSAWNN